MKAEELMIGDYFFVAKDNLCIRKGSVVEIRGIDADDKLESKNLIGSAHCRPLDKFQFEGGIWLDYLEPIPLTSEILEKNGVKFEIGASGYPIIELDGLNCSVQYNLIHYVHELQHAFRLCKIDKTIEI